MRKNKMMRLASALLVAVLLTTSVISGTYAKYVTENTGSDEARVAKWGVTVTANGDAFETKYEKGSDTEIDFTVVTDPKGDGKKLVAPGTTHNLVTMTLSGKPEVAVKVEYDATLELTGWALANGEVYCPIIFRVNNHDYKIGGDIPTGEQITTIDGLTTAVKNAIAEYNAEYDANTDLAEETEVATPDVSWRWPFETTINGVLQDSADTYLGNQASIGNAPTVKLTIKTTVTQID